MCLNSAYQNIDLLTMGHEECRNAGAHTTPIGPSSTRYSIAKGSHAFDGSDDSKT